jgi:hypothetical protein
MNEAALLRDSFARAQIVLIGELAFFGSAWSLRLAWCGASMLLHLEDG